MNSWQKIRGTDVSIDTTDMSMRAGTPAPGRAAELGVFLLLTVVLAPILAVAFVGGYGFLVWMYQLIAGPPGPPPL